MRIWNSSGGEVEACGNATRCVAWLLMEEGGAATRRIETPAGILYAERRAEKLITVDMGSPLLRWEEIPISKPMNTVQLEFEAGGLSGPGAANMGNPHVVFFVPDCDAVDLDRLGPLIEHDPLFPQRINVNVATITGRDAIRLRVWERGAGLTRACGTGACATAVAAMRRGLCARAVTVTLPGGPLHIAWRDDNQVVMTGPAAESFRGSFDPADYGLAQGSAE